MLGCDALHLARAQFAFTVAFHIVFPAFFTSLISCFAMLEGLWLKTGKQVYLNAFSVWLTTFAAGFATHHHGMLLALIFRGVAFEFRFRAHTARRRRRWG